jgi:hypothetical protein
VAVDGIAADDEGNPLAYLNGEWLALPALDADYASMRVDENGRVVAVNANEMVVYEYDVDGGEWRLMQEAEPVPLTGVELGDMTVDKMPQRFVYAGEIFRYDKERNAWVAESGEGLAELRPTSFFDETGKAMLWATEVVAEDGRMVTIYYSPHVKGLYDFSKTDGKEQKEMIDMMVRFSMGKVNPKVREALANGAPIKIMSPDMADMPYGIPSVFSYNEQRLNSIQLTFRDGSRGRAVDAYVNGAGEVIMVTYRSVAVLNSSQQYIAEDSRIVGFLFSTVVNDAYGGNSGIAIPLMDLLYKAGMEFVAE